MKLVKPAGVSCAIAAVLMCASPAKAADCHVARYSFVFQSDTNTNLDTKSGLSCYSRITAHTSIDSITIGRQPSHGTAFIDGSHRWGYRSSPGFVGQDAFVVSLSGTSFNKGRSGTIPLTGQTNIDVNVTVHP